ncbi:AAA family ATPase [Aminobacterium colombiense]|uniref:MinD/ParA family ATP-binding protein n=1 Tax=Aminobacterium colombiense TaxID=81468 RepID=UPI00259AA55E|nr:AAA family ATPase [uncultured Aminobacterium sp.]
MILSMVNETTINSFLRKRFSTREVFDAQVAVDFLQDNEVEAIVISEFMGTTEAILEAVIIIRKASPVKVIYISREIPEILGKALIGAGVLMLEGEFSENQLVALVEQYYNEDTIRRFADPEIAAAAAININLPSIIRQPIISIVGGSGSGKSMVAGALARVVGDHVKTVLVDISPNPKQHVYFDIKDKFHEKNINRYILSKAADIEDYLVEISKNLFLLPGPTDTRPEFDITSGQMAKLIDDLRELFDVIIFDCSSQVNHIATYEAITASREILLVTVGDVSGLDDITWIKDYLPANAHWIQNRYTGSTLNHVYVQWQHRQKPVLSIEDINYSELATAMEKGKSHPLLEKAARTISLEVLKIAPPEKRNRSLFAKLFKKKAAGA